MSEDGMPPNTEEMEERAARLVELILSKYASCPTTSIAALRATAVLAKMSRCPREKFLDLAGKVFDYTDVCVLGNEKDPLQFVGTHSEKKVGKA